MSKMTLDPLGPLPPMSAVHISDEIKKFKNLFKFK